MEVLQARIDSFKKSKRIKNPNKPSSTVTLRWPHPLDFKANPETLADAGFFYNPSYEGPDSVTCYICDKELEGWEDNDDPHVIHWKKCGQTCCWAMVRCGLLNDMDKSSRFVFTDKTRVPTHKLMEKARFDTFDVGKGWIHDQVKNHGANSKMMARAGFVYTPQQRNDDLVTCLYCDTSLSGWDAEDDPMEEHRKRKKSCPFFSATVPESAPTNRARSQSQSTKPPSKSKPPTRSTSKSKHQDILLPTKTHDGDPDNDSDSSQSTTAAKATTKTPRKGRSTRKSSAKTPRSKRSRSKVKAEDNEDIPIPRKSSRPKAKATEDHEIPPKSSRTRSKAKVIESEPEEAPPSPSVTRQKMKVVEVSSDEEPGTAAIQSGKKNTYGSTTAPVTSQPEPEASIVFSQSRKPKRLLTVEVVKPLLSVPTVSPIREVNIVMGDIGPEPETATDVYPAPSSPQRALPQTPPKKKTVPSTEIETVNPTLSTPLPPPKVTTPLLKTVSSTAVEQIPALSKLPITDVYPAPLTPQRAPSKKKTVPSTEFETVNPALSTSLPPPKVTTPLLKTVPSTAVEQIPALSKLPITPFHAMTEAELDMTVEEWVRYQIDVEYDKFRRDGERELQRFRNRAEEVRKVIERL